MLSFCIIFIVTFVIMVLYNAENEVDHPKYQNALDASVYNIITALIVSIVIPNPNTYTDLYIWSPRNILSVILYAVISHGIFYIIHRILHTPPLYKLIHKRHHAWNNVVLTAATFDCHLIEFWISNMMSFVLPLYLQMTTLTRALLIIFGTISVVSSHAITNENEHKKHHQTGKHNYGFGPLYWIDKLLGTYE